MRQRTISFREQKCSQFIKRSSTSSLVSRDPTTNFLSFEKMSVCGKSESDMNRSADPRKMAVCCNSGCAINHSDDPRLQRQSIDLIVPAFSFQFKIRNYTAEVVDRKDNYYAFPPDFTKPPPALYSKLPDFSKPPPTYSPMSPPYSPAPFSHAPILIPLERIKSVEQTEPEIITFYDENVLVNMDSKDEIEMLLDDLLQSIDGQQQQQPQQQQQQPQQQKQQPQHQCLRRQQLKKEKKREIKKRVPKSKVVNLKNEISDLLKFQK